MRALAFIPLRAFYFFSCIFILCCILFCIPLATSSMTVTPASSLVANARSLVVVNRQLTDFVRWACVCVCARACVVCVCVCFCATNTLCVVFTHAHMHTCTHAHMHTHVPHLLCCFSTGCQSCEDGARVFRHGRVYASGHQGATSKRCALLETSNTRTKEMASCVCVCVCGVVQHTRQDLLFMHTQRPHLPIFRCHHVTQQGLLSPADFAAWEKHVVDHKRPSYEEKRDASAEAIALPALSDAAFD